MKKWIIRLAILAVVLFIAVIAALSFSLNRLVKQAINTYGPEITKVGTSVNSVVLLPLSGKGRIGGLFVGNPSGYSTPSAIKVGGVAVSVDTDTVMAEKIVIHSVNVNSPEITLEGTVKDNNLTKILSNIESSTAKSGSGKPADSEEAGAAKKLQIDSVNITGAKVNLAIPLLKGKTVTVPLQDIHLSNLGQGPEGVTAGEVSKQVIDQILAQTTVLIPKILAGDVLDGLDLGIDLTKEAGKLGIDLGKSGADGAGKAGKGAVEGAGKAVEGAGDAVKGLLKGLKKK